MKYLPSLAITICAVAIAVLHMKWPTIIDEIVIALLVLAASPWLLPILGQYLQSVEAFGTKLKFLEHQVEKESGRLDELYLLSMGHNAFEHVRKLGDPNGYGEFFVGTALPRELEYLENLGYIKYKHGMKGLDDFLHDFNHRGGQNLSEHIELTDAGKDFCKLRQEIEKKAKQGIVANGQPF
jgi:hypothetical protein